MANSKEQSASLPIAKKLVKYSGITKIFSMAICIALLVLEILVSQKDRRAL